MKNIIIESFLNVLQKKSSKNILKFSTVFCLLFLCSKTMVAKNDYFFSRITNNGSLSNVQGKDILVKPSDNLEYQTENEALDTLRFESLTLANCNILPMANSTTSDYISCKNLIIDSTIIFEHISFSKNQTTTFSNLKCNSIILRNCEGNVTFSYLNCKNIYLENNKNLKINITHDRFDAHKFIINNNRNLNFVFEGLIKPLFYEIAIKDNVFEEIKIAHLLVSTLFETPSLIIENNKSNTENSTFTLENIVSTERNYLDMNFKNNTVNNLYFNKIKLKNGIIFDGNTIKDYFEISEDSKTGRLEFLNNNLPEKNTVANFSFFNYSLGIYDDLNQKFWQPVSIESFHDFTDFKFNSFIQTFYKLKQSFNSVGNIDSYNQCFKTIKDIETLYAGQKYFNDPSLQNWFE